MPSPKTTSLRLNADDNVVVALEDFEKGAVIAAENVSCAERIASGHKIATTGIKSGEPIVKYGQIIGAASIDISPGQHVHTHNVAMGEFSREHAFGTCKAPQARIEGERATFNGILRPDGRVATRNYIGVVSSVNCSASVSRFIADEFRGDALEAFPHVDGVVPIIHGGGCAMAGGGEGFDYLMNAVEGYIRHPNFAGVVLVGLGCEVLQVDAVVAHGGFGEDKLFRAMNIQDAGGIKASVEKGVGFINDMLSEANEVSRQPLPASHIVLGLQCGGSDGYSGITANPALGAAVDLLVRNGGTAILGETPEIYGAEHLLTCRAASSEVGEKLLERIRWWEAYTARHGGEMDNNPTPGNKAGGLTTILEKSLGAVAKGGSTNLTDVVAYARPVKSAGLVFMDTPGYDPVSLTGMVAGGANMICFTTGRGSVYGCRPVPSLKLATNSGMYNRMAADMDINCGVAIDGGVSVEDLGKLIFEQILETASGLKTKSEVSGVGDNEFVPWQLGAVM